MPENRLVVLKFGSSVIPDEASFPAVAEEVRRWVAEGWRVIAVVSAVGGVTDALFARGRRLTSDPCPRALAAYVATGELQSVALLALSLASAGLSTAILDHAALRLRTQGQSLDASPADLDERALEAALAGSDIVLVPGFLGRSERDETTLLGRGGSDLTALFIAHRLGARCRLVKDVPGLYDRDPASPSDGPARLYRRVDWDTVLSLDEGIVQHKAVRFARDIGLSFEVGCLSQEESTDVGPFTPRFAHDRAERALEPIV